MSWRVVEKSETDILATASRFEAGFPTFYRDASNTWTSDEVAALVFYRSCEHLFGIFDGEALVGLLYLERINDTHKVAHLDALRGVDQRILLSAIFRVRDHLFDSGVKQIQTWVLRQNRVLQRMLQSAMFGLTGLEMRAGHSHGKALKWRQMIVTETA